MGAQIGELRSEMSGQIGRASEKTEVDVGSLAKQIADVRVEIKSLKARMYRLLLVQAHSDRGPHPRFGAALVGRAAVRSLRGSLPTAGTESTW